MKLRRSLYARPEIVPGEQCTKQEVTAVTQPFQDLSPPAEPGAIDELLLRTVPLYVIPEGVGTVNAFGEDGLVLCALLSVQRAAVIPLTGLGERPQRREDGRPRGRPGLTPDGGGVGGVA